MLWVCCFEEVLFLDLNRSGTSLGIDVETGRQSAGWDGVTLLIKRVARFVALGGGRSQVWARRLRDHVGDLNVMREKRYERGAPNAHLTRTESIRFASSRIRLACLGHRRLQHAPAVPWKVTKEREKERLPLSHHSDGSINLWNCRIFGGTVKSLVVHIQ